MGLDAVEMVMAFEDAFDIRIENVEGEKLVTPRLVIDFIVSKVTVVSVSVCLTHRAFNLFRKFLLRNSELKRSDIAPSSRLDCLIPKSQRRTTLEKFAAEAGIKDRLWLVRPRWVTSVLLGASVLVGLAAAILVPVSHGLITVLFFGSAAVVTGIAGALLTRRQRTEFPKDVQTVGDMALWIMSHKADLSGMSPSAWTRDQIAARVREIVIENLNCGPQYHEDARFVEELGMY